MVLFRSSLPDLFGYAPPDLHARQGDVERLLHPQGWQRVSFYRDEMMTRLYTRRGEHVPGCVCPPWRRVLGSQEPQIMQGAGRPNRRIRSNQGHDFRTRLFPDAKMLVPIKTCNNKNPDAKKNLKNLESRKSFEYLA